MQWTKAAPSRYIHANFLADLDVEELEGASHLRRVYRAALVLIHQCEAPIYAQPHQQSVWVKGLNA